MPSKTAFRFGAKEIRDILKSKAHCLQAGFSPDDVIIKTLNEIRADYIREVGLLTYLSQMLGPLATTPMRYCALYGEDGRRVGSYSNGQHNQPVQRFIARHFRVETLPFKVEICQEANPDQVEVRYL